jgi:hypothetical protein
MLHYSSSCYGQENHKLVFSEIYLSFVGSINFLVLKITVKLTVITMPALYLSLFLINSSWSCSM